MRYILNPNIALRSWRLVPYAYYIKGERNAAGLKKEEFEFLSACDGKTDLPTENESALSRELIEKGFIHKAASGENLSDWSRARAFENRYFPAMNLMITGKCNYNCIHCFNAAGNAPLMSEWTMEEMNTLLDQARDCGINAFTITGGEPMLHKNFFEIIEGIYSRGMFVEELNTNGHFINLTALERLKSIGCVPLVKISFDGIGYHDWMRNHKGAEQTALGTLKENNRKCGSCGYFELCNGGCRAIALALTGNRLGIDPSKCFFWENDYAGKIAAALPDYETNI